MVRELSCNQMVGTTNENPFARKNMEIDPIKAPHTSKFPIVGAKMRLLNNHKSVVFWTPPKISLSVFDCFRGVFIDDTPSYVATLWSFQGRLNLSPYPILATRNLWIWGARFPEVVYKWRRTPTNSASAHAADLLNHLVGGKKTLQCPSTFKLAPAKKMTFLTVPTIFGSGRQRKTSLGRIGRWLQPTLKGATKNPYTSKFPVVGAKTRLSKNVVFWTPL